MNVTKNGARKPLVSDAQESFSASYSLPAQAGEAKWIDRVNIGVHYYDDAHKMRGYAIEMNRGEALNTAVWCAKMLTTHLQPNTIDRRGAVEALRALATLIETTNEFVDKTNIG